MAVDAGVDERVVPLERDELALRERQLMGEAPATLLRTLLRSGAQPVDLRRERLLFPPAILHLDKGEACDVQRAADLLEA